ncbi:MAG: Mur ligase family protein [Ferruginibacter sp.]
MDLSSPQKIHFIGVAGVGMSAIAQYLAGTGHIISGSDREFGKENDNVILRQLTEAGIKCFPQDGTAIHKQLDGVIISTAIEDTVTEFKQAKDLGIKIFHRADMLKMVTDTKKTIAVSGTSGKSTTSAMLFHILHESGFDASIISGAGLVNLQKQGKIGNAYAGKGDWLVIEADESDGTLIKYHPEVGVMLNLDKDHKEMNELHAIFAEFKKNIKETLIVNEAHHSVAQYSQNKKNDIGYSEEVGFRMNDFMQNPSGINFKINNTAFEVPVLGEFNMENATAACAAATFAGATLQQCSDSLKTYEGIYRRMQLLAVKNGITIYDDYAHNPVKISAAIHSLQPLAKRIIAWFQPHGYGPTRFLRDDFVKEISNILRADDQIWMSEIFYAGGTAIKDISAADLINDIKQNNKQAFFIEDRKQLPSAWKQILQPGDILLLMGARDPSLEEFANFAVNNI